MALLELMTAAEAAAFLGYNVEYFRNRAREHKFPFIEMGDKGCKYFVMREVITRLREVGSLDSLKAFDIEADLAAREGKFPPLPAVPRNPQILSRRIARNSNARPEGGENERSE